MMGFSEVGRVAWYSCESAESSYTTSSGNPANRLRSGQAEGSGTPCGLRDLRGACHPASAESIRVSSGMAGGLGRPFGLRDLRGACHSVSADSVEISSAPLRALSQMGLAWGPRVAEVTM